MIVKPGDRIERLRDPNTVAGVVVGGSYIVSKLDPKVPGWVFLKDILEQYGSWDLTKFKLIDKENTNMFTEIVKDGKEFIKTNKAIFYWIASLYLVDHFCFNGAGKQRLQNLFQTLLGKVEEKVNNTKM